jgi:hypothetical protein
MLIFYLGLLWFRHMTPGIGLERGSQQSLNKYELPKTKTYRLIQYKHTIRYM